MEDALLACLNMLFLLLSGLDTEVFSCRFVCVTASYLRNRRPAGLLLLTEAYGLQICLDRRRHLELVFILVGLSIQFHWMPINESLNCIDGCSMNYTCYYMFKY